MKTKVWKCQNCDSTDVEGRVWYDINNQEKMTAIGDLNHAETYCHNCQQSAGVY